jgi:hypothetical protein
MILDGHKYSDDRKQLHATIKTLSKNTGDAISQLPNIV